MSEPTHCCCLFNDADEPVAQCLPHKQVADALEQATADRGRQKKSREHWINRAEKLEILARRLWIRINGDDEFFESSVAGQLLAGASGMSESELLIDCVKDATKERDELADAVAQERKEHKKTLDHIYWLVGEQDNAIQQIAEYCRGRNESLFAGDPGT